MGLNKLNVLKFIYSLHQNGSKINKTIEIIDNWFGIPSGLYLTLVKTIYQADLNVRASMSNIKKMDKSKQLSEIKINNEHELMNTIKKRDWHTLVRSNGIKLRKENARNYRQGHDGMVTKRRIWKQT